jgi:hypothetical protein
MRVTFSQRGLWRLPSSVSVYKTFTLKKEEALSSEMLVPVYQTARHHIMKESNLNDYMTHVAHRVFKYNKKQTNGNGIISSYTLLIPNFTNIGQ